MSDLLQLLRDEAVTLVESDLPSAEELRPLVGSLVKRLERLEQDVVGELKPAPPAAPREPLPNFEQAGPAAPPPVAAPPPESDAPTPVAPAPPAEAAPVGDVPPVEPVGDVTAGSSDVVTGELEEAQAQLEYAQARVDALKAEQPVAEESGASS